MTSKRVLKVSALPSFAVLDPAQAGQIDCLIQVFALKKINLG
jgi:hypothetical protein